MKHAIIAIEDRRFYTNDGVDLRGIGRALYQDVVRRRRSRAARRSRSSSSRTRSPPRTSARCSRSCARPRSRTSSRASGRRSGSSATTSTRSTSATAPTASSRPRARTSAANHAAAARRGSRAAPGPRAARGGAARRHGRVAERLRPDCQPGGGQARATSCSSACSSRATSPAQQYDEAIAEPLPDARRPPARRGGHRVPVLHLVGQAAGRRPLGGGQEGARWRSRAACACRRRSTRACRTPPRRAIDAWLPQPRRPARLARGDRQRHRRGPGDGRRRRLRDAPVQPRHPGPAPARLGVQAVRARRGARRRASRPNSVWASKKMTFDVPEGRNASASRSTTTRTPTRA